jgi:hypothetical protein
MYPIYYFAASSPFVKYPIAMSSSDERLINAMIDKPIDERTGTRLFKQDPLEQIERYMANMARRFSDDDLGSSSSGSSNNIGSIFRETHSSMPLKEYVRKWSNWVLDFHWIFTLNYFIDLLPANKLYYFIKNYPSLDNFILYWMWWSYSLSKEVERVVQDPFRSVGSMPWLELDDDDDNDNDNDNHNTTNNSNGESAKSNRVFNCESDNSRPQAKKIISQSQSTSMLTNERTIFPPPSSSSSSSSSLSSSSVSEENGKLKLFLIIFFFFYNLFRMNSSFVFSEKQLINRIVQRRQLNSQVIMMEKLKNKQIEHHDLNNTVGTSFFLH